MMRQDILTEAAAVADAAASAALRAALRDRQHAYCALEALCDDPTAERAAIGAAVRAFDAATRRVRTCWALAPVGTMPPLDLLQG